MASYRTETGEVTQLNDSLAVVKANRELPNIPEFKTLLNYSKVVAIRNNVDLYKCSVYFYATYIKIPKFAKRHENQSSQSVESLVFKSKKYQLK